jgi:hypothetical protein
MDLTVNNFFSHLILKPWEAKDTKSKVISSIASAALALLSGFLIHGACLIYKCIKAKPLSPVEKPKQETPPSIPGENLIRSPSNEANKVLNDLLGTRFNELPIYPIVLEIGNEEKTFPSLDNASFSTMKGITSDGRNFVTVKLGNVKEGTESLLILGEVNPDEWHQKEYSSSSPRFFDNYITFKDGSGPTPSQQKNFDNFKKLHNYEIVKDLNGVEWQLTAIDSFSLSWDEPLPTLINPTQIFKNILHVDDYLLPPHYPEKGLPQLSTMRTGKIQGVYEDKPYLAVKAYCQLTDDIIEKLSPELKEKYKNKSTIESLFIVGSKYRVSYKENMKEFWGTFQTKELDVIPHFFVGDFTFDEDLNPSDKKGFETVQELFQKGLATDLNGITWRIPGWA